MIPGPMSFTSSHQPLIYVKQALHLVPEEPGGIAVGYFVFEDYNGDELYRIFEVMCKKNKYTLNDEAAQFLKNHFQALYETRDENFGNARDVRNTFENVVSVHSDRVAQIEAPTVEDLTVVIKEDVEKAVEM